LGGTLARTASEQDVIAAALSLDVAARGRVADLLLASLDNEVAEPPLAPEWEAEITRRVAEVRAGTAKLVDHETVFRRVRERFRK